MPTLESDEYKYRECHNEILGDRLSLPEGKDHVYDYLKPASVFVNLNSGGLTTFVIHKNGVDRIEASKLKDGTKDAEEVIMDTDGPIFLGLGETMFIRIRGRYTREMFFWMRNNEVKLKKNLSETLKEIYNGHE